MKFLLINIFTFFFGNKFFYKINLFFYKMSLYNIGYNNFNKNISGGEKRFLDNIIKNNKLKICIDIGAYKGDYSNYILKNSNSKVIAFEAQKKCFFDLNKIKKNYNKRFDFFISTLGSEVKSGVIFFNSKKSQLTSLSPHIKNIDYINSNKIKKEKIKLFTLDYFLKNKKSFFKNIKKIDLLKIDTEGYEYEVLKGSLKTIKKFKPNFIQIEMNWHHMFSGTNLWIINNLINKSKNYDIYRVLPRGKSLVKIDPRRPENNLFNYSNYIFIKKNIF